MKNLFLVLVISIAAGLAACSPKEKSPEEKLQGKWEITAAEGYMADLNKGTIYELGDQTATISKGILKSEATWKLKGDTLELTYKNMPSPFNFIYAFEGEKLVLRMNNANEKYSQKFTLEKK
ncbi:MAG: hypothetical protein KF690_09380 [Bacteroidetes bacterium]|nr:hypothetical protein [Bacteroidota bacterium]